MTAAATHVYRGRKACGHVFLLVVDDGAPSNAKEIAKVIRGGGTVERVTLDEARSTRDWCSCSKAGPR